MVVMPVYMPAPSSLLKIPVKLNDILLRSAMQLEVLLKWLTVFETMKEAT